jgi:hypothetical protein
MASYGEVLEVLRDYRNTLEQQAQAEVHASFAGRGGGMASFSARGGMSAFATPLSNVHATGVGVRVRRGEVIPDEFVLKVYVFDKVSLDDTPALTRQFGQVDVDVEPLPIQLALQGPGMPAHRQQQRPITGGLSIAPLNESHAGTLGCFLRRTIGGTEQVFALSNNHVLADTNRLPVGTCIVQPGPEVAPTQPGDAFAALSAFVPIHFPDSRLTPVVNRLDAAIALVADLQLVRLGEMSGIDHYTPQLLAPVPGMRVIKSGRTTGVTTGTIIAARVNGVIVNYGTQTTPRLATFNDTVEIVGAGSVPFSLPGDSGSVILERESGRPVALLFAGDGVTTTACDLGAVCQQFQAFPV